MGQKVNPIGLRLGINRTWDSRWYADRHEYSQLLHEDLKIREFLKDKLKQAGVARIIIERPHKKCRVTIHSARPGVVIGKKGADIEKLRKEAKVDLAQTPSNRSIYLHLDQFRDETPFAKAKDGSAIKNPLRDKRVREALTKAINRDAIVSRVMEGAAVPASQYLPEGYFGIAKGLKPVAYDLEGAKKLLAAAGFPAGFKLTLHGPNGRYLNDVRILEAVAQMFTRAGIDTTIETLPPASFFTRACA